MSKVIQYLVLHLGLRNSKHQLYFLIDDKDILPPRHVELKHYGTFFFEKDALKLFEKIRIDSYFLPNLFYNMKNLAEYLLPSFIAAHHPRLYVLVHDLIPWLFKEDYLKDRQDQLNYEMTIEIMRKADHLFAVSMHTKQDLIDHLQIPEERISTVYNSGDLWSKDLIQKHLCQTDLISFSFGNLYHKKYLIYISGNDSRKNHFNLIQSYALVHGAFKMPLVVVALSLDSVKNRLSGEIKAQGLQLDQDVFLVDFLTEDELIKLIANAYLSIFPSFYEGLGLPIIESYLCETPIIGSNTSSMKELIHPLCQFDPYSISSISEKMREVLRVPERLDQSLTYGKGILEKFSGLQNVATIAKYLALAGPSIEQPVKTAYICSEKKDLASSFARDQTIFFPVTACEYMQLLENDPQQQLYPLSCFTYFHSLENYRKIEVVLRNRVEDLPLIKILASLKHLQSIKVSIYLKDILLLTLFAAYLEYDLEAFKRFFYHYYQQDAAAATNELRDLHDLSQLSFLGIRALLDLCSIEKLQVDQEEHKLAIQSDLGFFFPIQIEVVEKSTLQPASCCESKKT